MMPKPLGHSAQDVISHDQETPQTLAQWDADAKAGFRALERKIRDDVAFVAMTDTWVCVTFDDVPQREAFMAALGHDAALRELDGRALAALLGIALPESQPMRLARVNAQLAAISLPVPLGATELEMSRPMALCQASDLAVPASPALASAAPASQEPESVHQKSERLP